MAAASLEKSRNDALPPLNARNPQQAKVFTLYRNGDLYFPGKKFTWNQHQIKTFDTLLEHLSNSVNLRSGAVRRLYTPENGHRVKNLTYLEEGKAYVAAPQEAFKKIDYSSIEQIRKKRNKRSQQSSFVQPVIHSRHQVSGRIKRVNTVGKVIKCWANGEDVNEPHTIHIPPSLVGEQTWDRIYDLMTFSVRDLTGPVVKVYTRTGQEVPSPQELEHNGYYVAAPKFNAKFRDVEYKDVRKRNFHTSPVLDRRVLPPVRSKNNSLQSSPDHSWASQQGSENGYSQNPRNLSLTHNESPQGKDSSKCENTNPTQTSTQGHKKSSRILKKKIPHRPSSDSFSPNDSCDNTGSSCCQPPPVTDSSSLSKSGEESASKNKIPRYLRLHRNRKNLAKQQRQEEAQGQGFYAKPIAHKRSGGEKGRNIDYDQDKGGVFKAKHQNRNTRGAHEVKDSKDTRTDLPVDQRKAQVVSDEEADWEAPGVPNGFKGQEETTKKNKRGKENGELPHTSRRNGSKDIARNDTNHGRIGYEPLPNISKANSYRGPLSSNFNSHTSPPASSTPGHSHRESSLQRKKMPSPSPSPGRWEMSDEDKEMGCRLQFIHRRAATKIQAQYRGHKTRKELESRKRASETEREASASPSFTLPVYSPRGMTEDEAATKIQAYYRGNRTRKQLSESENVTSQRHPPPSSQNHRNERVEKKLTSQSDDETFSSSQHRGGADTPSGGYYAEQVAREEAAATKIQAAYRGYATRHNVRGSGQED